MGTVVLKLPYQYSITHAYAKPRDKIYSSGVFSPPPSPGQNSPSSDVYPWGSLQNITVNTSKQSTTEHHPVEYFVKVFTRILSSQSGGGNVCIWS